MAVAAPVHKSITNPAVRAKRSLRVNINLILLRCCKNDVNRSPDGRN